MPIYEYECEKCGLVFEQRAKMADPNPECPKDGHATRKLISRSSFHLKGSGWAADGY